MTEEKQKIPELKVIPAEELLDTTYAPSGTGSLWSSFLNCIIIIDVQKCAVKGLAKIPFIFERGMI